MIIDKDYPGLINHISWYEYPGDIIAPDDLEIMIPLKVEGFMAVGRSLIVKRFLTVKEFLTVGGSLTVGWFLKVGDFLKVERSLTVGQSLTVKGFFKINESLKVGDTINVFDITSKSLFILRGTLFYPVYIFDDHIKIGCYVKTKAEWQEIYNTATEQDYQKLGDDGTIWANREILAKFL